MPFCPHFLINNLLKSNWETLFDNNLFLISSSIFVTHRLYANYNGTFEKLFPFLNKVMSLVLLDFYIFRQLILFKKFHYVLKLNLMGFIVLFLLHFQILFLNP